MIVRISGEGQFEVPDHFLADVNDLDAALEEAVSAGDEPAFGSTLLSLLERVRTVGALVPDDVLLPSEAILPAAGSSLAEVQAMLGDEGLIPG